MKHLDSYDRFSDSRIDEAISWSDVKAAYKRARQVAVNVIKAFKQEGKETSDMLKIFNYQLRKKLNLDNRRDAPTPEEIEGALQQLKDIPKLAPYAVILLTSPIPFSSTMYTGAAIYLKKIDMCLDLTLVIGSTSCRNPLASKIISLRSEINA